MLYGPTRHSTAKEASQRTVYRRSAQECVQLDLNHVIAEECETRKCLLTAAASHDAELDRGDGICVAIFGPPKIYLPGLRCSLGYYKGRVSVMCMCYSLLLSSVCYTVVLRYSSIIM